jgi:hypothetical protein
MRARVPSACLAWATLLALGAWNTSAAKPPDLPQDTTITCGPVRTVEPPCDPLALFPAAVISSGLEIEPLAPPDAATIDPGVAPAQTGTSHPAEVILIGDEVTPQGVIHHRIKLTAPQLIVIPGQRHVLLDVDGCITADSFSFYGGPRYIMITGVSTEQPKVSGRLLLAAACDVGENKAAPAPASARAKAAPPADLVCPYLQEKARAKAEAAPETAEPPTVLENLRKVLRAGKLFEKGKRYADQGAIDQARDCFAQVKQLCPGSPYDAQASAQLLRLKWHEAGRKQGKSAPHADVPVLLLHEFTSGPPDAVVVPQSSTPIDRVQGEVAPGTEEEDKPAEGQSTPEHPDGSSECPDHSGGFVRQVRDRCLYEIDCGKGQVECGLGRTGLTCRLVYDGGVVWQCGVVPWLAAVVDAAAWGVSALHEDLPANGSAEEAEEQP